MHKLQLIKHNNRISVRFCEFDDDGDILFIPKSSISIEGKTPKELELLISDIREAMKQPVLVTNKTGVVVGKRLSDIEQMFDVG